MWGRFAAFSRLTLAPPAAIASACSCKRRWRIERSGASHLGDEQPQRRVLYHDAELGFAILGHVFHEARHTKPHDHGATWAIYAQVEGTTLMDEWEVIEAATAEGPGRVRKTRTYELTPGHARTYDEGVVHSPRREGPAKLLRIEGGPIAPDIQREYEIADDTHAVWAP